MAFGYPGKGERRLVAALGVPRGYEKAFRAGFSHPTATADKAYGQLSQLIGHIGEARWDSPLGVDVHQPVDVAYAVLDALESCGATAANAKLQKSVDEGRALLTNAV